MSTNNPIHGTMEMFKLLLKTVEAYHFKLTPVYSVQLVSGQSLYSEYLTSINTAIHSPEFKERVCNWNIEIMEELVTRYLGDIDYCESMQCIIKNLVAEHQSLPEHLKITEFTPLTDNIFLNPINEILFLQNIIKEIELALTFRLIGLEANLQNPKIKREL